MQHADLRNEIQPSKKKKEPFFHIHAFTSEDRMKTAVIFLSDFFVCFLFLRPLVPSSDFRIDFSIGRLYFNASPPPLKFSV